MSDETYDFSGLRAMFVNCTLKRSPEPSNTQGLVDASAEIMRKHGVEVEVLRAVDHDIASGVYPDMTEHGWATDEWPQLYRRCWKRTSWWSPARSGWATTPPRPSYHRTAVRPFGAAEQKGQCALLPQGGRLPDHRQRRRHQALFHERPLQPAAHRLHHPAEGRRRLDRCGGPGSVVPGPGHGGPENDFTNRNTTFMTWNLLHFAGCSRTPGDSATATFRKWKAGTRFDFENPEYRS